MGNDYWHVMESPVGALLLVSDGRTLQRIVFQGAAARGPVRAEGIEDRRLLAPRSPSCRNTLPASGAVSTCAWAPRARHSSRPSGSELQRIPYGTTISYRELARRIGRPRACRAVGLANGANPLPIMVPCHRVIGADGSLTGFGGGCRSSGNCLPWSAGRCARHSGNTSIFQWSPGEACYETTATAECHRRRAVADAGTYAAQLGDSPARTELHRADLSGAPGMEVIASMVRIKPGETSALHSHHGIESAYVVHGAMIQYPDHPPQMLKTGSTLFNLRDMVHSGFQGGRSRYPGDLYRSRG